MWSQFLVHLCKILKFLKISLGNFFFQNFDFCVITGLKEQKLAKITKNFCLSRFIYQDPYIIWLPFMVHLRNGISRRFFHFFKILIFRVVRGLKGQKMVQKEKKFCLSCFMSQEQFTSYDFHLWYTCVK